MNKILFLLFLFLMANTASAARVVDVSIISITPAKDTFELKLHASQGPKDSYFIVDIVKSDPASFDKLGIVIKKLEQGDDYKLDLDIPSFSMQPSGSFYRSEYVRFFGTELDH